MSQAGHMKYRVIGTDPATRRSVSVLSLGAMLMGSRTDEETSFAILDRYVSAGGRFGGLAGDGPTSQRKRAAARPASLDLVVRPFGYRDAVMFFGSSDPWLVVLVHS